MTTSELDKMPMSELLGRLHARRIVATEAKIRHGMKTCRLPRPPMDQSKRFQFDAAFVELAAVYLKNRMNTGLGLPPC